jgi:hypothetical protein
MMRVIDAEKLDEYLSSVVEGAEDAAWYYYTHDASDLAEQYRMLARDIRTIANHVADSMVEEGVIYLPPPQSRVQSRDGQHNQDRVGQLFSKE